MSFKYDENNKVHRMVRQLVIIIVSLTAFVLIWWFISIMADTRVLPNPMKTFEALIDFFEVGYLNLSQHGITYGLV